MPPQHEHDGRARQLDRQAAELDILQRVSTDINSTLDLEEVYETALRTMDRLFEFHHATILLVEPGGEMLRVVASRGYENQAIGGRVRIGTGVTGTVAAKQRAMHVGNLGQQRAYAATQRRQMVRAGRGAELGDVVPVPGLPNAESQIAIPLLIREELVGVLSIESPERQRFDEHDRHLVSIVANQIASAIRNARLYDERRRAVEALQEANVSLEARVAARTADLERELRVAQELLRDARSRVEGPLLGASLAVSALREAIAREARVLEPLLLTGPPGSGDQAVAYAVHGASGRSGAFIVVSCAELQTEDRATTRTSHPDAPAGESWLRAKFDVAAGGTLFLEAIHELPVGQRRLLGDLLSRHRQTGLREESAPPDARIIASTVGTLDPALRALFTRQITLPALIDRREDIPVLARHYVGKLARQFGKAVEGVSPASMRRLESYSWPGNINELRTVLERAVLVSRGGLVEIDEELLAERTSIGSYRLVSPLGSGGMGQVWLARHRLLARPAAVKLIRHDRTTGEPRDQLVLRFQREAQVTAGLRSPHTVQLYDFGVNETGSFYYVMELLEGLDLNQIVTRFGPQPSERVAMLLRQACRSLAEAHEGGLIHRDIKPANLFVARLGQEYDYLKVLDFGIVKGQPGAEALGITAHGVIQGTPAFMAPELVFESQSLDGRTDLYSLACVAYWALTGQLVFADATTPEQMLLHHARTPPVAPSVVSEVPIAPDLEAIIMRCLAKRPSDRPGSALELDADLAGIRFTQPWTQQRARDWWAVHAPDRLGGRTGAVPC
jgi:DNA-binding NtrC family response regulator